MAVTIPSEITQHSSEAARVTLPSKQGDTKQDKDELNIDVDKQSKNSQKTFVKKQTNAQSIQSQTSSISCDFLKHLSAIANGSGIALIPFLSLNGVIYLIALYLSFSVIRIRHQNPENYRPDPASSTNSAEIFSPLLDLIKQVVDYVRSPRS